MFEISAPVATVIASFAGVIVAVLTAVVTYATTKKREREAEIRKEKLEHYKEFMISLSGVMRERTRQTGSAPSLDPATCLTWSHRMPSLSLCRSSSKR